MHGNMEWYNFLLIGCDDSDTNCLPSYCVFLDCYKNIPIIVKLNQNKLLFMS